MSLQEHVFKSSQLRNHPHSQGLSSKGRKRVFLPSLPLGPWERGCFETELKTMLFFSAYTHRTQVVISETSYNEIPSYLALFVIVLTNTKDVFFFSKNAMISYSSPLKFL